MSQNVWILILRKDGLVWLIKGVIDRWNAGSCAESDVCLSKVVSIWLCIVSDLRRDDAILHNSVEILALASTMKERDRYWKEAIFKVE